MCTSAILVILFYIPPNPRIAYVRLWSSCSFDHDDFCECFIKCEHVTFQWIWWWLPWRSSSESSHVHISLNIPKNHHGWPWWIWQMKMMFMINRTHAHMHAALVGVCHTNCKKYCKICRKYTQYNFTLQTQRRSRILRGNEQWCNVAIYLSTYPNHHPNSFHGVVEVVAIIA